MVTPHTTSAFQIDFSVSPIWFRAIRGLVTSAALQCGFDHKIAGQVAMATDEALCNILRHGYQGDATGHVVLHVKTSVSPHPHLSIQIDDETIHVDIGAITPRDLDEIKPGGLGLHLIHSIMDDVAWSKLDHGGTRLTMAKTYTSSKTEKNSEGEIKT